MERTLGIGTALSLLLTALPLAGALAQSPAQAPGPPLARALIQGCEDAHVRGEARLVERPSAEGVKVVDIVLRVTGLPPGAHAVHIHETASCTPCKSAGGHFDPGPHGAPDPDANHPYHSGDLVNVHVNRAGQGALRTTTSRVSLSPGPLSLFDADGSAFIVHVDPDSYCPQGPQKGCAGGARAACGVIEAVNFSPQAAPRAGSEAR